MSNPSDASSTQPASPAEKTSSRPMALLGAAFPFLLMALLLGKFALVRYLALGETSAFRAVAFEGAAAVLLVAIVDLLPKRRSYTLDLVIYAVFSAAMFANTLYTNYYDTLFDPRMLAVAGQVTTVGDVIGDLLAPVHLLFAADLPLLIVLAVALRRFAPAPQRRDRIVAALAGVALVAYGAQVAYVLRLPADVDGLAASRRIGISAFQVVNSVRGSGSSAEAVAQETVQTKPAAGETTITAGAQFQRSIAETRDDGVASRVTSVTAGQLKGKNVIVIQVEALQSMIIDQKIGDQEITPNLNKLAAESYYFPNAYSETGAGNTADAEFIVNTSMLPLNGQAAAITYTNRELTSLPRLLDGQGYTSITLHQNEVQYWNRAELYAAIGFDRYYDRAFFKNRDKMWRGSSDEVLFEDGLGVLQKLRKKDQPFYAQFITLSSHTPFTYVPASRRPLKLPYALRGSIASDYLTAESYTDKAIGEFVDQLKATGLWDDSIVVLYGDHMALKKVAVKRSTGDDPVKVTDALLHRPYGAADYQRIPLMIHVPGQSASQVVTTTVGQIDIMPTIADMVGLDISDTPHLGRSILATGRSIMPLRAYYPVNSFVNDHLVLRPGISFDDANAWTLDGQPATLTAADRADYERARKLGELSAAWISTLPIRKDAKDPSAAFIPTDKANWGNKDF